MRHRPSFADRLPLARRHHRWLLPLYPTAIESLDLSGYDLVLSSSHCVAKGAIPGKGAVHVCYCHTPVRYAWDRTDDYIRGSSPLLRLARPAVHAAAAWLRAWDRRTVGRVDRFVANSENTAAKIRRFYGREAVSVPPPVECERFEAAGLASAERAWDLLLGALVPYKRADLAIEAWRFMPERQLVVVGEGPELARLSRLAPPNVRFVGRAEEGAIPGWFAGARLLVFPGEEDFGIVPVEAQAAGTPVVAFARGGALESVVEGETGLFFTDPGPGALAAVVRAAAGREWSASACRANARRFDRAVFLKRMRRILEEALAAGPGGRSASSGAAS
jgi:glycosyltransferase involved in cell wall biosynthesis